jgi:hypothetical protein
MANKKMTKRDYFMGLKAKYNLTADEVAFIDHEIELLDKKNSADKKPTAQQLENEKIKKAIVNGMQPIRLYSITDIIKEIPECNDLTNQRVSALIKQMLDTEVERVEEKRKAYFRKIG